MIRPATPDDVPALVALGRAMHAESNYACVDFSAQSAEQFIRWVMAQPCGFIAVAERDGLVVGFMGALATPAWFGTADQLTSSDYGLYVTPEYRRGASAIRLVEAYVKWARALGCVQVRAGTNAGEAGQAANAIYEHFGLRRSGYCFVLDNVPPRVVQSFDRHLAVQ